MSSFRKLADVLELFCPDSATEKKQTADTATGKSTVPDESRDERIRRVDEVIRKYRGRTYLEEMEEILKMNAYASTAGDHNTVSANAQWLLEQKAPEDMTPKAISAGKAWRLDGTFCPSHATYRKKAWTPSRR